MVSTAYGSMLLATFWVIIARRVPDFMKKSGAMRKQPRVAINGSASGFLALLSLVSGQPLGSNCKKLLDFVLGSLHLRGSAIRGQAGSRFVATTGLATPGISKLSPLLVSDGCICY